MLEFQKDNLHASISHNIWQHFSQTEVEHLLLVCRIMPHTMSHTG